MPPILPRLVALVLLLSASSSHAAYDFGPWPTGTAPTEIGQRVTDNFLPRPHMPLGKDPVIHYAEVCTWYGAMPGLAGRSPSYLVRQMFDLKTGQRHCKRVELMKPVVANLSTDDMLAIAAYLPSRTP